MTTRSGDVTITLSYVDSWQLLVALEQRLARLHEVADYDYMRSTIEATERARAAVERGMGLRGAEGMRDLVEAR